DELGCDLGVALGTSLRPAILDRDGATLDPPEFMQSRHKSCRPSTPGRRVRAYKPDRRQFARLLRARRERPRGRRTAECDQQLPPSDGDCHTLLPREVRRKRYYATSVLSYTGGAGEAHAGHMQRGIARPTTFAFLSQNIAPAAPAPPESGRKHLLKFAV